jgi:hypothetical protein
VTTAAAIPIEESIGWGNASSDSSATETVSEERLRAVTAASELLPVAVDDEQRVVDREPEAEPGDEVQ